MMKAILLGIILLVVWGCILDFVKKDAVMSSRLSGRSTDWFNCSFLVWGEVNDGNKRVSQFMLALRKVDNLVQECVL